jgi:hypothetical protein
VFVIKFLKFLVEFNIAGMPIASKHRDFFHENTFDLEISTKENFSPEIKLVVYYIDVNEIIPDYINLKMERCLNNKVK